jgi:serine/threonine protein kinase
VKLLDFGIAKLAEAPRGPWTNQVLDSTAARSEVTDDGQVVGTPSYMSPEQVRSEPLDARTDLFGLGAVLYEMVSGQRAFPGSTAVEVKYAILHTEPPALSAKLPLAVAQLIRHCLEKDREKRFQSATDLAFISTRCGPRAVRFSPRSPAHASFPGAGCGRSSRWPWPWEWCWPSEITPSRGHRSPRPSVG